MSVISGRNLTVAEAEETGDTASSAVLATRDRISAPEKSPTQFSKWYIPGTDVGLYDVAQEACRASKARLQKLKLTTEEKQLLVALPTGETGLVARLKLIMEDRQKHASQPKWLQNTGHFFVRFCKVTDKASDLVETLLPQSPEYKITFGLLMLIFRAVVTKSDREDALIVHLESLAAKLPVAGFYRMAFPTNAIKIAVAKIFSEMMKFLDEALIYYRSPRLRKLLDAMVLPADSKFDNYAAQIESEVKKLESLKNIAHEAQAIDTHETVSHIHKSVGIMYEEFKTSSSSLGLSLEVLNTRLRGVESRIDEMNKFQMVKHVQDLEHALFSSCDGQYWDAETALSRIAQRGFRLSPRDHWDNNGVLKKLISWSRSSPPIPLLWVGGTSGNQDPWVTELSLDIVMALLPQQVTLIFVFCSEMADSGIGPTPGIVVKNLIAQLLRSQPQLAYKDPMFYSPQRFGHVTDFFDLWQIFESLITSLSNVYIVIDRVEECSVDQDADLKTDFLPALARLMQQISGSRVIITSIYDPPDEILDDEFHEMMDWTYIDTRVGH